MAPPSSRLTVRFTSGESPDKTFRTVTAGLRDGLSRAGVALDLRAGGPVRAGGTEVGTISDWAPGKGFTIRWHAMPWRGSSEAVVRLELEGTSGGTGATFTLEGWEHLAGETVDDLPEWAAADLLPHALRRWLPEAIADWVTDRRARRPSGRAARETYVNPRFHWPNLLRLQDVLRLGSSDRLLEVGCGAGAFLSKALESGCSATGIDHSPEMVELSSTTNRATIDAGRARILEADAAKLPVEDGSFTACVSTGAFGFFPDPAAVFREMHRALAPEGRLAVFASTAALRGTPAAPEPIASRVRFYEREELAGLAREAGFSEVTVVEPDLSSYAEKAGLDPDAVSFFRDPGGALLLTARKAPRR